MQSALFDVIEILKKTKLFCAAFIRR